MEKYQLLESWRNGDENAQDKLYCESDLKENLEEILSSLSDNLKENGLGFDFPSGSPRVDVGSEGVPVFYLGKSPKKSEHWRSFKIVETKPLWGFAYDEQFPDIAGRNFIGIISNGKNNLFWHAFAEEEGQMETCHIYDSMLMEQESEICTYPWTAENDSLLIETLNNLQNPEDWCGEACPLRTLKFHQETE